MDLGLKIVFKMSANEIITGNESDDVVHLDRAKMDKICEKVELNTISKAFSRVKIKSLSLKPNLYLRKLKRQQDHVMYELRIKAVVLSGDSKFRKIFSNIWGPSGAWLTFSCPHGVVYYLKFLLKSQNSHDYIDGYFLRNISQM